MNQVRSIDAAQATRVIGIDPETFVWMSRTLDAPLQTLVLETDEEAEPFRLTALGAIVPETQDVPLALALQERLTPLGFQAQTIGRGWTEIGPVLHVGFQHARQYAGKSLLVVYAAADCSPLLEARCAHDAGAGRDSIEIARELTAWSAECRYRIPGIGPNWLVLCFDSLPEDLHAFAARLIDFCPGVLDENLPPPPPTDEVEEELAPEPGVEELAAYLTQQKRITLRWIE